jgi:ribonuclease Z
MIKLTFLGTSSATATKERNFPSVALEYDGDTFLFDCGEGTQRQLAKYGINPFKIRAILLTHIHGDHVIGVAGLVRTLAMHKRSEPLDIYIPEGYEKNLRAFIMFDETKMTYTLAIKGIRAGTIIDTPEIRISAFRVRHSVKCYGYVFVRKDRLRFIKERCASLGIRGEMFAQLERNGKIKINGKIINIKDVTFNQKGKKIVYVTDTRPAAETVKAAKGADILIHEATYHSSLTRIAKEYEHATSKDAAEMAKRAGVKRLVMHHLSARYNNDASELEKEARKIFKESVFAKDGMTIEI